MLLCSKQKFLTVLHRGHVGTTVTNMNRIVDNNIFYLVFIKGLHAVLHCSCFFFFKFKEDNANIELAYGLDAI